MWCTKYIYEFRQHLVFFLSYDKLDTDVLFIQLKKRTNKTECTICNVINGQNGMKGCSLSKLNKCLAV